MSYPRYPKYKDSGVEWLGQVPAHWAVVALKRIADVHTGVAKGKDNSSRTTITVPYLRVANVQDGYLDLETVATIEIPANELDRYALKRGDVLMNEGGDFDKLGRGCVWEGEIEPCITQNHVFAVRPRQVSSAWLNAIIGSNFAQFYFMTRSKQSTNLASISSTNLMELPVVIPPAEEQQTILSFLADQTSRFDALMNEAKQFIELLREKRQAVISHAVTQGLNPHAPMKPSGIEWIGDLPAHWRVMPMRMIANVVRGASPRPAGDPRYFGGNAVPWVTVAEITKNDAVYLTETENFLTQEGAEHSNLFRSGTLIYSNSGATLGVPKILRIDACANDGVVAFLNLNSQVQAEFLYQYLSSITGNIREKIKQGSGQPNLNTDLVKDLRFGVPPLNEQHLIVQRIAEIGEQFGFLICEAQRAIDLLQERRTALISAAVTGQIDVRQLNEKLPA